MLLVGLADFGFSPIEKYWENERIQTKLFAGAALQEAVKRNKPFQKHCEKDIDIIIGWAAEQVYRNCRLFSKNAHSKQEQDPGCLKYEEMERQARAGGLLIPITPPALLPALPALLTLLAPPAPPALLAPLALLALLLAFTSATAFTIILRTQTAIKADILEIVARSRIAA